MINLMPQEKNPFSWRVGVRELEERFFRWLRHLLSYRRSHVVILLTLLLLLFGFFVGYPAYAFYKQVKIAEVAIRDFKMVFSTHDLRSIDGSLDKVEASLIGLIRAYRRFGYLHHVPFISDYYRDGQHLLAAAGFALESGEILVDSLKPFSGLLGLERDFGSMLTTEQLVANLVEILPQISSQIDDASGKIFLVKKELDQISIDRYPEEIGKLKLRFWWEESRRIISDVEPLLGEAKSLSGVLPKLLGIPQRRYLVLFQNDAELRATGGFITAIGLITLKNGKITDVEIHDVGFATNRLSAWPGNYPVARYLRTPGLLFHDTNYSPDFKVSAEQILEFWQSGVGLPSVDAVIAINTGAAARVLEFTGPVVVPGYDLDFAGYSWLPSSCQEGGKAFTSGNLVCRLEFWVERIGGNERAKRGSLKGSLLGKLSETLIDKLVVSPAEAWAQIVELGFEMLQEGNILFYSKDAVEQKLFETLGFAGRIKDFAGDYLHISDSNLGGKKTDMFMQEAVEQSLVRLENGIWRKTVMIHYFNPQPYDNWVSANYKDWVRIYVPKGSTLVKITGASIDPGSWEELGKTVFGVFFNNLWPQTRRTVTFVYDLPPSLTEAMEATGIYKLLVQKQPGTNIGLVSLEIGGKIKSFDLKKDLEVTIPLSE